MAVWAIRFLWSVRGKYPQMSVGKEASMSGDCNYDRSQGWIKVTKSPRGVQRWMKGRDQFQERQSWSLLPCPSSSSILPSVRSSLFRNISRRWTDGIDSNVKMMMSVSPQVSFPLLCSSIFPLNQTSLCSYLPAKTHSDGSQINDRCLLRRAASKLLVEVLDNF